jgi:hypothetical protein
MIDVRSHSEYIINHNYIFRGNMLQFYEDYKSLYPDQEGEIFWYFDYQLQMHKFRLSKQYAQQHF